MSPEKQRVAIAEACGCVSFKTQPSFLPDYLSDLNAMHEAEKVLTTEDQLESYGSFLNNAATNPVSCGSPEFKEVASVAMTTAAQRAEAFLRTIGKWEDV